MPKTTFTDLVDSHLLTKYNLNKYDNLLKKNLYRYEEFHFQDFYKQHDETSDEIKKSLIKKSLGDLLSKLMEKELSFFKKDNCKKLNIDSPELKRFFQECLAEFFAKTCEPSEKNQKMLGFFASFVLSLRIIKEIDLKSIVIEFDEISDEEAKAVFVKDLLNYEDKNDFKLGFNRGRGRKAADKFTHPLQLEARCKSSKKSYIDIMRNLDNKLFDIINYHFQGPIFATLNIHKIYTQATEKCIDSHHVAYELAKKVAPRQFPPVLMLDVISLLQKNYQFKFPVDQSGKPVGKMLDPCGGWGARMVAAMAHSGIIDYTVIEPNIKLEAAYKKIDAFYNPISIVKTTVNVITKGVESVTDNDIGNKKFQLIFTSPPYRSAEIYNDNSLTHYEDDKEWNRLIASLYNMSKYLDEGGLIVFNIAKYRLHNKTYHDIPNDFFIHLSKEQKTLGLGHLGWLTSPHAKINSDLCEKFIVARKIPAMILMVSPPEFQPELSADNRLTYCSKVSESKEDSPLKRARTFLSELDGNRSQKFSRLTHHEQIPNEDHFINNNNQQENSMANTLSTHGIFRPVTKGLIERSDVLSISMRPS